MAKATFLNHGNPLLTVMVQADNPERVKELVYSSLQEGAEAFGMQFCRMKSEYRNKETYKELFAAANGLPIYVTNYRGWENEGKTDAVLADEIVELADCGATLCDITADVFDKQKGEFTTDTEAVKQQIELINKIHERGAEVIMSSHICEFTPAERVLEIAKEQERRGADISKIVVGANNAREEIENLRIIDLLKENLKIPFLLLSSGESRILRRIGGEFGCCMYLCVYEHDEFSTRAQPLLKNVKKITEAIRN